MPYVYDFTLHALDRRVSIALRDGNLTHARMLTTVMGMYTNKILDVEWESGEPTFQLTSKGEEIVDEVSSVLERIEGNETETQEE